MPANTGIFTKLDDFRWMLPRSFKSGMRTDAVIYAGERMLGDILKDNAYVQAANVACLPGIVGKSLAMPDIHFGYGFPIGGVAAFDPGSGGIISPGGVGYDINCGVRILRTDLTFEDVQPRLRDVVSTLASEVPSGVGSTGHVRLSPADMDKVLTQGSKWAVRNGYGEEADVTHTESEGCIAGADPELVSKRAKVRGTDQLGTLGSGNHFLEVQVVDEIFDESAASSFGLFRGQVTIMVHSGSRGLGHQVCTDYIDVMTRASQKYGISLPDRQLCCAPVDSPEGREYFAAMAAAANYAWANRQMLMHWARDSFSNVFGSAPAKLGIRLVYDVAHNVAKMEEHDVDGKKRLLCVHRKGATRAFPGQPVLVPGDMGRCSYVLVGTERAMEESWGSVCHGAGRAMSRSEAMRTFDAGELIAGLQKKGIIVSAASRRGLVEEAPEAYKDVSEVVDVVAGAGLARKVARMRPIGVVKG